MPGGTIAMPPKDAIEDMALIEMRTTRAAGFRLRWKERLNEKPLFGCEIHFLIINRLRKQRGTNTLFGGK